MSYKVFFRFKPAKIRGRRGKVKQKTIELQTQDRKHEDIVLPRKLTTEIENDILVETLSFA